MMLGMGSMGNRPDPARIRGRPSEGLHERELIPDFTVVCPEVKIYIYIHHADGGNSFLPFLSGTLKITGLCYANFPNAGLIHWIKGGEKICNYL